MKPAIKATHLGRHLIYFARMLKSKLQQIGDDLLVFIVGKRRRTQDF